MSDDHKPQPPNLDLIQMVQNARMLHDNEAIPSRVSSVYWIECKRLSDGPAPTARSGEFRVTTRVQDVDALWARIKVATESGELGYKSKVSTRPAADKQHPYARLICIRTYDADDSADLTRIEAKLHDLGIDGEIPYVRDSK